ncbi:MAG: pirin family protein [Cyanobacteria bacterium]|nr:pirin family protein [Cyanobacteriota bacterium]
MTTTSKPQSGIKRGISKVISALPVMEGAGVRILRTIGTPELKNLDPFLMLDAFSSNNPQDYLAGFPEHPHRGFQTVTYMLAGQMEHQDNQGNTGLLEAGSVQWMNAGRGILHSEMPRQENGLMAGFQMWINLPSHLKMSDPAYQELKPWEIPVVPTPEGVVVKVVAGALANGVTGGIHDIETNPLFLDIALPPGTTFTQNIPDTHQGFVYVFEGTAHVEDENKPIEKNQLGVLSSGDTITLCAQGGLPARLLLVAAEPIHEPIVQRGPFVMNTMEEIHQAMADYSAGRFGG